MSSNRILLFWFLFACSHENEKIRAIPYTGFHIAETENARDYLDRVSMGGALRANIIRVPVDWAALEPGPGEFDSTYLSEVRERVEFISDMGMKAILMFSQSPEWANGGNPPNYPPDSFHYDDYACALVHLYEGISEKDAIMGIEVWNEPNSIEFWPVFSAPREGTYVLVPLSGAIQYGALLDSAYTYLKRRDSTLLVAGGSLASADTAYLSVLIHMFSPDSLPMDVLSIHPYTRPDERDGPHYGFAQYPDQCNEEDPLSPPWCFEEGLENVRFLLDSYGADIPMWITEYGVSSGYGWGDAGGEMEQKKHIEMALNIISMRYDEEDLNVRVFVLYRLFDEPDDSFGVYRVDGSLKPAGRYLMEFLSGQVED